jgi:Ribose/xylose/arabinose/galactoside ABC-type transport systems, permease components
MIHKKALAFLRKNPVFVILAVFIIVPCFLSPRFMTLGNWANMLMQSSGVGVVALGATLLAINGYKDLSAGAIMCLSAALAVMTQPKIGMWGGIAFALVVASVVGLINGILAVKVGLDTYISSLAMMLGCKGIVYTLTDGYPISAVDTRFAAFGEGTVLGISNLFIVFLVLLIVVSLVLSFTTHGRNSYACGGNMDAARNAGINVMRTSIINFVVCAVGACIGGVLMAMRANSFYSYIGFPDTNFMIVVMIVMGGTKMQGGVGHVINTWCGVLVVAIFQNVFNLMNINPFYSSMFTGLILIVTLLIDNFVKPGVTTSKHLKRKRKSAA